MIAPLQEIPDIDDLLNAVVHTPGITTTQLHQMFPRMARQDIYNRLRKLREADHVRSETRVRRATSNWYPID